MARLVRAAQDAGLYPVVGEPDELRALEQDPAYREQVFLREMEAQVARWVELAEERIGRSGVAFYMMPGNDDHFPIDRIIERSAYVRNPARQVVDLPGGLCMLSCDYANPTPWRTPREWPEEEYYRRLRELAAAVDDMSRCVWNIHVPPYDTGLDTAPLLDEQLRPIVSAGDVLRGPVGSTAVRRAIEEMQPLLGMFGHIHESAGETRIGRTVLVNPGSETESLVLKAHVIDVVPGRVERYFRVQG